MIGILAFVEPQAVGTWRLSTPLQAEIVAADGTARWLASPYERTVRGTSEGALVTPGGSRLLFSDRYHVRDDGFTLDRTVRVVAVGQGETAFSTRFAMTTARIPGFEALLPGVAYRRNAGVPLGALAGDLDAPAVLVREDRLPLPPGMARHPHNGSAAEMVPLRPDGATFAGEEGRARIVDERMRFGSIGFFSEPVTPSPAPREGRGEFSIAFQYPGSEGNRSYVERKGWSLRSHPLRVGFEQRYALRFSVGASKGYAEAVQKTWRKAFDEADPRPPKPDLGKVYRAGMALLARYGVRYDGVPSMPFQARLSDGIVTDTSSQMGFVGKALPCAALMLGDAKDRNDPGLREQAEALIDFWVENSMNPSGVPKTWVDIHRGGIVTWRTYPTHLRIAGDGMRGVLDAYRVEPRPPWLAYARRWGDFLVDHQSADGSFAGRWKWDGGVDRPFRNATDHTIPFLVDLYEITRDERYRAAALRAGEFCLASVHEAYAYVGGTADNPNVLDKEAGVLAMQAFLALHDLTHDSKWIAPAAQAATFAETWTYGWNVPVPPDDPKVVFPGNRTTLGVSLIAAGHSGADDFMALTVADYVRLCRLTGDAHFLRFAQFLQRGTAQLMNWDGKLGYAYPGLMMEALNLASPRGHGVKGWLPWLTVAILEPMVRLRDAYGTYDADRIGKRD